MDKINRPCILTIICEFSTPNYTKLPLYNVSNYHKVVNKAVLPRSAGLLSEEPTPSLTYAALCLNNALELLPPSNSGYVY